MQTFQIEIPEIDLSGVETDEQFREAALRVMPTVLARVARLLGERSWAEFQKAFRGPGVTIATGGKIEFVDEFIRNFPESLTNEERQSIESDVIDALKRKKVGSPDTVEELTRRDEVRKPQVFVASSKEGVAYALAIQENLGGDAECTVWKQGVFDLSSYPLEALTEQLEISDFGVFVFSPDDDLRIRGEETKVVRDNVILELGIFIGGIGRKRCYIVLPHDESKLRIASDLQGLTISRFNGNRSDGNIVAALGPACSEIKRAMTKLGLNDRAAKSQIAVSPINKPAIGTTMKTSGLRIEAESILLEASRDRDGIIMMTRTNLGVSIQTNDRVLNERGNPRSEAEWRAALETLVSEEYVREIGHKGEVFELTDRGWKAADAVKDARERMLTDIGDRNISALLCADLDKSGIVFPKINYEKEPHKREKDLDAARELEKNGWAEKREDGKYYVTSAGQDAAKAAWHEIGSEMIHTMQGGN